MHGVPARNVSTRQKGLRPETRCRDRLDRDRDETRDAPVRDETLVCLETLVCPHPCGLTAASPSFPVDQSQSVLSRVQDLPFQAGLSLTFPLRTIEEVELN